jgi:hypothetical protein
MVNIVKVDAAKARTDAIDKIKALDYTGALKSALDAYGAKRNEQNLSLVVDCFLLLKQEGKVRAWLKEKQQLDVIIDPLEKQQPDVVIDGVIELRKKALVEDWHGKVESKER